MQSTRPPWNFPHPTPARMMSQFRDPVGAMRERPLVHGIDGDGVAIAILPKRTARDRKAYDVAMAPRSPLNWCDPSLISIGHARAEYVAWYGALVSLARKLAGALKEYEAMPPSVKPAPWITGQTPASRVLDDGLPPGVLTVRLPLAPKRHAPGRPIESRIEAQARQARAQFAADTRRQKRESAIEAIGKALAYP